MKKAASLLGFFALLLFAVSAMAVTPEDPKLTLKAGQTVYACACGAACPCKTLSEKPGKCSCGKKMAKSKVVKVEGDTAVIKVKGKDETFPLTGKFVCGCGASCPCNTISQTPGKCTCGKDLVPAK